MSKFMRRVSAREAQLNSKSNFEIATEKVAKAQMTETVKLLKILQSRGRKFPLAAKIAKRAYRMGIRSI